jgi:hypothetical protein
MYKYSLYKLSYLLSLLKTCFCYCYIYLFNVYMILKFHLNQTDKFSYEDKAQYKITLLSLN